MLRRSLRSFKLLTQRLLSSDMQQPHGVRTGPTSTSNVERGESQQKRELTVSTVKLPLRLEGIRAFTLGIQLL